MKVFEKIGRVLDDVMGVDGSAGSFNIASFIGLALLILLLLGLALVLFGPTGLSFALLIPIAGGGGVCIFVFLKELYSAVCRNFFEK
jgi:hypothetical protein